MTTKTFKWNQPSGKVWTIETSVEGKYIKTIDENGTIIQEQKNLSEGAIEFMIENFISIVTQGENKISKHEYNSMYA